MSARAHLAAQQPSSEVGNARAQLPWSHLCKSAGDRGLIVQVLRVRSSAKRRLPKQPPLHALQ
jgi:hypothetical protein